MPKNHQEIAQAVSDGAKALSEVAPDAMAAFANLGRAAYRDGALSRQTKELIALAIGIAARCDGCVAYHARTLVHLKATREQVAETIAVAVQMGGGPSMIYGAEALRAYDTFAAQ